jgi:hypothetical protein
MREYFLKPVPLSDEGRFAQSPINRSNPTMRRLTTLGLGLVLASTTLAACGSDSKSSGDSTEAYCARIKAYEEKTDSFDALFAGDEAPASDDMKEAFTSAQEMITVLKDKAPAEIKSDVTLMANGIDEFVELFEKYDWDIMALGASPDMEKFQSVMDNPEAQAASDRLDEFSETKCGIVTES